MVCVEVIFEDVVSAIPVDIAVLAREGMEARQTAVGMPSVADETGHVGLLHEPSPTVSVHIYLSSR